MPDLTKGHTFISGEEVDHTKLNNLVGNAIINDGAVDSSALADSSVTNAKVSATAAVALSKLATGSDAQVIVGSSGGVPTYVAMSGDATISNAGAVTIGNDKVITAKILDANVTTAKIADDAVTADKLANTSVTAASYTNASITVDAQGRLSAASNGAAVTHPTMRTQGFATTGSGTWTAPTGVTRAKFTIVGAGGARVSATQNASYDHHGGGAGAICIVSAAVTAGVGYSLSVGAGQAINTGAGSGDDSSVTVGATTYTAGGGSGGGSSSDSGSGGTATNGDINLTGENGASGSQNSNDEGFGGEAYFNGRGRGGSGLGVAAGKDGIIIVEWME